MASSAVFFRKTQSVKGKKGTEVFLGGFLAAPKKQKEKAGFFPRGCIIHWARPVFLPFSPPPLCFLCVFLFLYSFFPLFICGESWVQCGTKGDLKGVNFWAVPSWVSEQRWRVTKFSRIKTQQLTTLVFFQTPQNYLHQCVKSIIRQLSFLPIPRRRPTCVLGDGWPDTNTRLEVVAVYEPPVWDKGGGGGNRSLTQDKGWYLRQQ